MKTNESNKRYFIEFAKIYKRLMEVEIQLRERILLSFKIVYKEKAFYRFKPFLNTVKSNYNYTRKKDRVNGNKLNDIINNSKKNDDQKFHDCIHILSIRDLLEILNFKSYNRDKMLCKNIYHEKPDHNDVKHHSSNLANLRNNVMHFNFKKYLNDRIKYIKSLIYFENHLNCYMRPINQIPPIKKLSTQNILKIIDKYHPILFEENDRVLCDVFDDLAILNQKPADELPQYWTILRQRFDLLRAKGKIKKELKQSNSDEGTRQISILEALKDLQEKNC